MEGILGILVFVAAYYLVKWAVLFLNSFASLSLDAEAFGWLGPGLILLIGLIVMTFGWIESQIIKWKIWSDNRLKKLGFQEFDPLVNRQFFPITNVLVDSFNWIAIGPTGQEYTLDYDPGSQRTFLTTHRMVSTKEIEQKTFLADLFKSGTFIKLRPEFVEADFQAAFMFSGRSSEEAEKMAWTNHLKENLKKGQRLRDFFSRPLEVIGIDEANRHFVVQPYGTEKILLLNFWFLVLPRAIYLSKT